MNTTKKNLYNQEKFESIMNRIISGHNHEAQTIIRDMEEKERRNFKGFITFEFDAELYQGIFKETALRMITDCY